MSINLTNTPAISINRLKITLRCLWLMLLLCALSSQATFRPVKAQEAPAQTELTLSSIPNGFSGQYRSGDTTFQLETYHPSVTFFLARILKPDGSRLVECIRNQEAIEVSLGNDAKIQFDVSKKTKPERSAQDKKKLGDFIRSSDATIARKILIAAIKRIKEQAPSEKQYLAGFLTIAMVLGDESVPLTGALSSGKTAKLVKSSHRVAKSSKSIPDQCLGCCGPGCICTCYTQAC